MDRATSTARLVGADFGVLGTVDAELGVHLVPVVFVVIADQVAIPIDTVKAKSSTRLRRVSNLNEDGRATLLVDHRSEDWAELWWVRAQLYITDASSHDWRSALAEAYAPYRAPDAVADLLTFDIVALTGWSASPI